VFLKMKVTIYLEIIFLLNCGGSYVPTGPVLIAASDRDFDGVPDKRDKCPSDPEDKDGFADYDGCPEIDMDKDTIPDEKDRCPTLAEVVNGLKDEDGCPDALESDERCKNGCPDMAKIEKCQIKISEPIYFDYDSAVVKEESFPVLDAVAQLIVSHPELGVIRIEGHTDNVGDEEYNHKLSQERVLSVGEYLVLKGVPSERLVGVGYGETRPLTSNDTEEGRRINRRVEFHIADCK